MAKKVIVIGEGWSALGVAGFAIARGDEVVWIAASGARMIPPLPMLESGLAAETWKKLAEVSGVDVAEALPGSFLREFRNKAFREAAWERSPTPESRKETRAELLWAPECGFAPIFETRFDLTLAEIEEKIRAHMMARVTRIEGTPVSEIVKTESGFEVGLASGVKVVGDQLVYADKWSLLSRMGGLPKSALSFTRKRGPLGVLQAVFTHSEPVGAEVREGFLSPMPKEPAEEIQRSVLGHFMENGTKSVWTLFLGADETEDNHEIAKKLRRMKSALDKMFTGSILEREFGATVASEHVRFHDAFVFSEGELPAALVQLPGWSEAWFLTDGYGPSAAMTQVAEWAVSQGIDLPTVREAQAAPQISG